MADAGTDEEGTMDANDELGGEAACLDARPSGLVIERALDATPGSGGAVWSLPHDGDLDANLVRLDPRQTIGEHLNDEVDVLLVVRGGGGELSVDGLRHPVAAGDVALVRRHSNRSIAAGPDGLTYLTVHRRRRPLAIRVGG